MNNLSSSVKVREVLGNTQESYPWNVLNVEELDIFPISVFTQKQEESDHEESCCHKDKTKGKNKFNKKKKNFYSKEDSGDESEDVEILFIGTTNSYKES